MEKKNMRQILLCLVVSYCCAHAMEQEKKLHPLLALPSDLKVEILCRLFSKNEGTRDVGKKVRPFLFISRKNYFDGVLQEKLFEKIACIFKLIPARVWVNIPSPQSRKNLENVRANFMGEIIASLLKDDSCHYPLYQQQLIMLLEVYPPLKYPGYYVGNEEKIKGYL